MQFAFLRFRIYFLYFLSRLQVFENCITMIYDNLYYSQDGGELKTLVLDTRIILIDFLFEKVFDTKFSGEISFMNGTRHKNFEVSFEEGK